KPALGNVKLDEIVLARVDSPLLQLLRVAIKIGGGISGIRFTNNEINGNRIEDAYIYRLTAVDDQQEKRPMEPERFRHQRTTGKRLVYDVTIWPNRYTVSLD